MISINKIIIAIISFILFIWLINTTFIKQNNTIFEEIDYKINESWVKYIEIKNDEILLNQTWSKEELKINYLNQFDKILSLSWAINFSDNKKEIEIKKWIYLFNISEINSSYKIKWLWFNISTKWPWSIFIDNTWIRTTIFSLNSKLELNLINIENNKTINTVSLYPHNFIKIIPEQNKNIENADILRLTQRFPLEYIGEKIIVNWKVNSSIINKLLWDRDEKEVKNVENMFMFIYLNNENNDIILEWIKWRKFWILLWEKLIKKYNILFLNEKKKTVYYKNLIIRNLWDIINVKWVDNEKNDFLITSLNELKEINIDEYNEMKKIYNYYSYLVINWYKNDIESKINFSKIYSKLEWTNYVFKDKYLLSINDIYFKYDFKNDNDLFKNLNYINNTYPNTSLWEIEKSYLIFFLNKVIISWFEEVSKNKDISFEDIIWIFNTYVSTSIDYYSMKDEVRIKTWLEEYNNILNKLSTKIKNTYFEEELNKQGLLVINKDNNISLEKVKALEINIKKILDYYEKNKWILWDRTKDDLIKWEFENSKKRYEQYISALKDYQSYIANYNEQNKQFLFWDTVNEWGEDEKISVENAIKYLEKFSYIDLNYSKINLRWYNYCNNPIVKYDIETEEEPYCYKIENIVIWWNLYLNLILSPKEYNTISNFIINWDKNINKWSYKLDNEKITWDENFKKNSWSKNIDKYKFENFFLYVFNPPQEISENTENIENENIETIEESLIVKIFKRNKLLWENWDFNTVKWFINIWYDDIIVKEENNNNFNIYIKKWKINYQELNNTYNWYIYSKYEFIPGHSFIDPEFELNDEFNSPLYYWSRIKTVWSFNINDSKKELIWIFENLKNVNLILLWLNKKFSISNFDITYKKEENIFYINNTNENIEIKLKWISIQSIKIKWKEYISKPSSIFDFEKIL